MWDFISDEEGASAGEYGMIAVLILFVLFLSMFSVFYTLCGMFANVPAHLQ